MKFTAPVHALAHRLVGFQSSTLRVRIEEWRDGCAWIVTADLLDAGTSLVLDISKVEFTAETQEALVGLGIMKGGVASARNLKGARS